MIVIKLKALKRCILRRLDLGVCMSTECGGEVTAIKKRPKQRPLKEDREVAQQLKLLLLERKLVHSTCFRWLTAAYNPRPRVCFYKKENK